MALNGKIVITGILFSLSMLLTTTFVVAQNILTSSYLDEIYFDCIPNDLSDKFQVLQTAIEEADLAIGKLTDRSQNNAKQNLVNRLKFVESMYYGQCIKDHFEESLYNEDQDAFNDAFDVYNTGKNIAESLILTNSQQSRISNLYEEVYSYFDGFTFTFDCSGLPENASYIDSQGVSTTYTGTTRIEPSPFIFGNEGDDTKTTQLEGGELVTGSQYNNENKTQNVCLYECNETFIPQDPSNLSTACTCPIGQHKEDGSCVSNNREVSCGGLKPQTGTSNDGNDVYPQNWNGSSWVPQLEWQFATEGECTWSCGTNQVLCGNECLDLQVVKSCSAGTGSTCEQVLDVNTCSYSSCDISCTETIQLPKSPLDLYLTRNQNDTTLAYCIENHGTDAVVESYDIAYYPYSNVGFSQDELREIDVCIQNRTNNSLYSSLFSYYKKSKGSNRLENNPSSYDTQFWRVSSDCDPGFINTLTCSWNE